MRRPSIADERLRHPLLTDAGRSLLRWMGEHPHAPRWNYACGDQLDADGLRRVRDFARRSPAQWGRDELPSWLIAFTAECLRDVPFYRSDPHVGGVRRAHGGAVSRDDGGAVSRDDGGEVSRDDGGEVSRIDATVVDSLERFRMLPFCGRDDLLREPWAFVPDGQPLDDMIVYDTSGTTGNRALIMADPAVSSSYLPLLQRALATRGVRLDGGAGRVSILLVGAQAATLTYASVSSYLDGAGFVKLNLSESEWRRPEDAAAYVDACAAEVISGDPLSFEALASLPLTTRPKAMVSSAMALSPSLRDRLEAHFGCPVLDVYSLTECRLLAVATPLGHRLLRPDVYVETVDERGQPSERGEIAISGGGNPFLPLLRYRTGDHAALRFEPDGVYLDGLEGRAPVVFLASDGRRVNNIDVTRALEPFPLSRFSLHQDADRALTLRCKGHVDRAAMEASLRAILGAEASLRILDDDSTNGSKLIRYSSDLTM